MKPFRKLTNQNEPLVSEIKLKVEKFGNNLTTQVDRGMFCELPRDLNTFTYRLSSR